LCVKSLARWIAEGLGSSRGIPEPGRVSVTRKRMLKNAYGTMVKITRALGKKSTRRTTSFDIKDKKTFEEFLIVHYI